VRDFVVYANGIKWLLASLILDHFSNFLTNPQFSQGTGRVTPAHVPLFACQPIHQVDLRTLWVIWPITTIILPGEVVGVVFLLALYVLVMMTKSAE
jgi:hypothetical protein